MALKTGNQRLRRMSWVPKSCDGMENLLRSSGIVGIMGRDGVPVMFRLRMISDFLMVVAFGLVAPALLAPIARSRSVLLVSVVTFALCLAFLWDGLRTAKHLHH